MNDQNTLLAALQFQIDGGVDATVGLEALDRFATEAPKPQNAEVFTPSKQSNLETPQVPKQETKQPITHFAPGAPLLGGEMAGLPHAVAAAQAAQSIPELITAIEAFEYCELKKTARSTVVIDGNPAAQILILGEAPGLRKIAKACPLWARPGSYWIKCWPPSAWIDRPTC